MTDIDDLSRRVALSLGWGECDNPLHRPHYRAACFVNFIGLHEMIDTRWATDLGACQELLDKMVDEGIQIVIQLNSLGAAVEVSKGWRRDTKEPVPFPMKTLNPEIAGFYFWRDGPTLPIALCEAFIASRQALTPAG